jgi:hypothetical protein
MIASGSYVAVTVIVLQIHAGQRRLDLCSFAYIFGFSLSRKGVSRDSKEIANASDLAEPLTLSA